MRGSEIKKTVEDILWKSPTLEEKEERIPIVKKKNATVTDNGTITMDRNLKPEDIFSDKSKKITDESIESRKEEKPEGMSLLRKICFVLSFNGGILYILVLGWLLPCRLFPCLMLEDTWTTNLTNIRLTTSLMVDCETKPSLLIFGYSDEVGEKLGAMQISDGKQKWSKILISTPSQIFCHSGGYDFIINGKSSCVVTSNYFTAAFETETGSLIWERNTTSSERINTMAVNQETSDYLMAISRENLHVLSAMNGTEMSKVALPCSWTVDVKLSGPWLTEHGYLWSVVCEYEDGMEVYTFKERKLLDFSSNVQNGTFKLLLSQQSFNGSIDLSGDVTSTSRSLLLSRADMVVMVTTQAPTRHLHKTWERHFSGPPGHNVHVISAIIGHFTDFKLRQIAAAVGNGDNSTIYILRADNGSTVAEVELFSKTVLSLRKAKGATGDADILVVEMTENKNSTADAQNNTTQVVSYFALQYEDGKPVFKEIAEVEDIHDSNLSTVSDGLSNLLLASTTKEGHVIISRHLIKNNPEHSWCNIQQSRNTSTIMFFE